MKLFMLTFNCYIIQYTDQKGWMKWMAAMKAVRGRN